MRRWVSGILILLAGCGGRMHPGATVASAPAPAPLPPEPSPSLLPSVTTPPAPSTAPDTLRLVAARDSAADEALLDTLARVAPAASLPDLPVERSDLNVDDFADQPRVKYYLDYFVGRAHDRFQVWLERMARYEPYARAQFAAHNIPGDFVYLGLIESGFSSVAVSHSAAVGMWQFMIGTGKVYGLRADSWVDERRDPIKATDAAARHLAFLTTKFGSPYLAAAAYNAGAGRVQRGLGHLNGAGGDDDSLDLSSDNAFFSLADTRLLRDETRNYVPQLIAATILAKQPAKFGFEVDRHVEPFSRDSVMVDAGTGLDLIARLADTTLEAMHDLNPHLLRMITPPDGQYPVRVPSGSAARIAAAYAEVAPDHRRAVAVHDVKRGETVAGLSRQYGAPAELIRLANRSARGRALAPGTRLYIPVSTTIPVSLLREPDPPRNSRSVTRRLTLTVRARETVAAVARRAGVSVAVLRTENHLTPRSTLRAGQKLRVTRTTAIVSRRGRVAHSVKRKQKRSTDVASATTHRHSPKGGQ